MMNKKYLEDLYEYIGMNDEQSLIKKIADLFNVEVDLVSKKMEHLDFAGYVELTTAMNSGDKKRIEYILGTKLVPESANSYSTNTGSANSFNTTQGNQQATSQTVNSGDTDVKSNYSVDVTDEVNDSKDGESDDAEQQNDQEGDSLEEELNRLMKLSGIEETVNTGNSAPPSLFHSLSITNTVKSPKQIKQMTKSPKAKKPGPKTK